jgi:hypothetical protein
MPDEEEPPPTDVDGAVDSPITETLLQAFRVSELQVARPSLAALHADT